MQLNTYVSFEFVLGNIPVPRCLERNITSLHDKQYARNQWTKERRNTTQKAQETGNQIQTNSPQDREHVTTAKWN